jgi:hypothetical protein
MTDFKNRHQRLPNIRRPAVPQRHVDLGRHVPDGGFPQRRVELLADLGEPYDGSRRRAGGGRVRADEWCTEGVRRTGEASVCVVDWRWCKYCEEVERQTRTLGTERTNVSIGQNCVVQRKSIVMLVSEKPNRTR